MNHFTHSTVRVNRLGRTIGSRDGYRSAWWARWTKQFSRRRRQAASVALARGDYEDLRLLFDWPGENGKWSRPSRR